MIFFPKNGIFGRKRAKRLLISKKSSIFAGSLAPKGLEKEELRRKKGLWTAGLYGFD